MSLHLNRQCQRADALPPPVRLVPGIGCTDQEEARNERETSQGSRVRCCGAPYMCGLHSRQPGFLQLCCSPTLVSSETARPRRMILGSVPCCRFKTPKCLFLRAFSADSQALWI